MECNLILWNEYKENLDFGRLFPICTNTLGGNDTTGNVEAAGQQRIICSFACIIYLYRELICNFMQSNEQIIH